MTFIQQADEAILNFIQTHMHTSILDTVMPFISWLGNYGGIWIAIALFLLFFKKRRPAGLFMLAALLICFILNDIMLKPLLGRLRPYVIHADVIMLIPKLNDFSLPSGHSSSSFAAATVILLTNKRWGPAAIVLASLIAFSRLYLFMHFPSDVIAGTLLGIGTGFLVVSFGRKIIKHHNRLDASS